MPTYYARKAGNIDAADVWATTPSGTASAVTFADGDVLVANSFTVTVNVSTDLGATGEVRNDTTGGATAGGSFSLSNGVTLKSKIVASTTGSAVVTLAGSVSATIIGNIQGGSVSGSVGVGHASSGMLTVTGNATGGTGNNSYAILLSTSLTASLTLTGNLTGGAGVGAAAVNVGSPAQGTVTITGDVTGGSVGSFAHGLGTNSSPQMTITGNVTGGVINSVGLSAAGGIANVTGSITGGTGGAGVAVTSGTLTHTGVATGAGNFGITTTPPSTVSLTRARGGPLVGSLPAISAAAGATVTVDEIEYGDLGASPTSGPIRFRDVAENVAVMYQFGLPKKALTDPTSTGALPAIADVRSGVNYGGGTNRTGTMAVPTAAQVAAGVAVDATTGTAAVTPAVMQAAFDAALAAYSSGRLANCATVASTGQQIANALNQ